MNPTTPNILDPAHPERYPYHITPRELRQIAVQLGGTPTAQRGELHEHFHGAVFPVAIIDRGATQYMVALTWPVADGLTPIYAIEIQPLADIEIGPDGLEHAKLPATPATTPVPAPGSWTLVLIQEKSGDYEFGSRMLVRDSSEAKLDEMLKTWRGEPAEDAEEAWGGWLICGGEIWIGTTALHPVTEAEARVLHEVGLIDIW